MKKRDLLKRIEQMQGEIDDLKFRLSMAEARPQYQPAPYAGNPPWITYESTMTSKIEPEFLGALYEKRSEMYTLL